MDTSSALPAAAAAHLGGMARVPDASLPIDFSPGNPADFAALLAAQPATARMTPEASAPRGAGGNEGGRGGSLPDSGKRLPSGAAASRSRGDSSAEVPPGAAAAAARREARETDAAPAADATATGGTADDDAPCEAEARAERVSRAAEARLASADASAPPPAMPILSDPASIAVVSPVTTAPAGTAQGGLADVSGGTAEGSDCAADDAGTLPLAAGATAALRGAGTDAEVDAPLGRMMAAARAAGSGATPGGSASGRLVTTPEGAAGGAAMGEYATVAGQPVTTAEKASLAAAMASPGPADGSRLQAEGKPTAGGAVRIDAPPLAGSAMGGGMADNAGGAATRQGHREAPPSALPVAATANGLAGSNGVLAAESPATPAPMAAPPAGLSALAANAALAALRSGGATGAMNTRAGVTAEGALATVAGLGAAAADLSAGGASATTPAQGAPPPGLLAGLAPPPGSAVNSPRAAVEVQAPPGSPAFADELAGRVAVLVQQDAGGATLKLNPGHLGPVEVRVQVRDGEATVLFAAHHATTREALEGAAPRLRELLVQQGYTQVNVDVAAQGQDLAQRQAAWHQARSDGGGREGRGPWRDAPGGVSGAGVADALRPRAAGARGGGRLDAFA